jgi:hypothetical protein
MADLIDRMTFGPEVHGRPKILNHQFNAYLRLYADGTASRNEVATAWDLVGDEITQANQLADEIDALVGGVEKLRYVLIIDAIAMLLDSRDARYVAGTVIDKVKVKSDMGIV